MRLLAMLLASVFVSSAAAHEGVSHESPEEAATHAAAMAPILPFPVEIRAKFSLVDQNGHAVSEVDFAGRPMIVFFGYANCRSICSVALPRIAETLDRLGPAGSDIAPVLITIDPDRDTPESMGPALARWHERFIGLTGSKRALAAARDAFQVEVSSLFHDPKGHPIFTHGSFVYLVDPVGKVASVLPPVLAPERMAAIVRGHLERWAHEGERQVSLRSE